MRDPRLPKASSLTSESGSLQEFPKVAASAASPPPGSEKSSGEGRGAGAALRPPVSSSLLHQQPRHTPLTLRPAIVDPTEALSLSLELMVHGNGDRTGPVQPHYDAQAACQHQPIALPLQAQPWAGEGVALGLRLPREGRRRASSQV